jgi:hypothetical protein
MTKGWPLVLGLLTVNFHQPSHEFTFGVGMSFISYPLVLTPWYNKFTLACRFWSLLFTHEIYAKEETFGISSSSTLEEDHEAQQELRHVMNMTPNDPRTEASTCKSSGTQPENSETWMTSIQALTAKEITSKAHMQVHTNRESREKQPGKKPGPNRAKKALGRPAWADRPGPFLARFGLPFDLAPLRSI